MTTYNHTAIPASSAANTPVLNAPLAQLDAAIGNVATLTLDGATLVSGIGTAAPTTTAQTLTGAINELDADVGTPASLTTTAKTNLVAAINEVDADVGAPASLTTTAKTSLVEAINELDAQIGAAASSSGTIGTSIDTDGTLKAGAVDVAAVLAADVVTAAKLDAGAVGSPNLAFDPFNRYYDIPAALTTAQDGRRRWESSSVGTRTADSSAPSGYVMRATGTGRVGRKLWLDEAGLKIGDVISCAVLAKVATGRTIKAYVAFRDAAYGLIGSASGGDEQAGDDAVHLLTVEGLTIPALCTNLDVFFAHVSGTGTVDVHGWYLMRGDRVHDDGLAEGISDGQRAEAQIQAAALDSEQPAQTISALRRNLCQDPYNQLYIVSDDKTQDGYLRFYAAASTAIAADTANPFGLPTCTLSASTKGRKFHLAEMGLAAGDVVSFGILGKWAATSSWYVYIVWRNSAGGSLGTASGTATAGTAALQFIDLVNLTVPATTVSVDFLLVRSAGSDNIDVYGWYCVQSTSVSGAWARELAYGQRSTDLGAWALKRERKPVPHANLERLWSWRNAQSRLYEAESDRHARVVCIGDSYTATPYRWVKPLAARLAADLGGGSYGTGFVSAHSDQYGAMTGMPKWTSVTRNGTWTQRAAGTGRGLDLCDATSTAGGDYYDLAGTFDTVRIHYLKQTGGGTFKTSVDGGSNWSANTDTNAADGFGVVEVTGCTNALRVYANGETVTMLGFVCYDTNVTNGIVVHKLGRSGATTAQWAAATANAVWQAALADLVPDLCIVWLGANTIGNAGASDVGYKADLLAIMGYIRTAQAALDTLLIAPPEHSTAHYTTFATYAARVRELAWEYPCGMIAMNQHIAYDTTDPLDLFEDATHINAYGGSLAAGVIYRALKW